MQVIQHAEPTTYAVVGGGKTQSFSISDDPVFFDLLSNGLYQNKVLAVVREVLCNAVDAHIAAGVDKPVEVTLTGNELTIKDFGLGIAPEMMGPIYCTYGASTKAKIDSLTGGFGLGCKAPFSISDHFTVVSCHKGTRTIYAIHKGELGTANKPGFREMASGPCDSETGLTVTVPIRSVDYSNFKSAISKVVYNGGMNVMLNGEKLFALDVPKLVGAGYGIVRKYADLLYGASVFVLYGNVVYPVAENPELRKEIAKCMDLLPRYYDFVIHAPASSISVTPSRESLQYNSSTVDTLKRLIKRAIHEITHAQNRIQKQTIKDILRAADRFDLITPFKQRNAFTEENLYAGALEVATALVENFLKKNAISRHVLYKVAAHTLRDHRHFLFDVTLTRSSYQPNSAARAHYTQSGQQIRYIQRRVVRAANRAGLLAYLNAFNVDDNLVHVSKRKSFERHNVIKNKVFISPTKTLAYDKAESNVMFGIVHQKIKPAEIERFKIEAAKFGIEVQVLEREIKPKPVKKVKVPAPVVETKYLKFEPSSINFCSHNGGSIYHVRLKNEWLTTAKAMMAICYKKVDYNNGISFNHTRDVCSLADFFKEFVGDVVVVHTKTDRDKLKSLGVRHVDEIVLEMVEQRLKKPSKDDIAGILFAFHLDHKWHRLGFDNSAKIADQHFYPQNLNVLRGAIETDLRSVHAAFGISAPVTENRNQCLRFWRAAFAPFKLSIGFLLDEVERERYLASCEKFEALIKKVMEPFFFDESKIDADPKPAREKVLRAIGVSNVETPFEHLIPILPLTEHYYIDALSHKEDLYEMIGHNFRRLARKKVKEQTSE